MAKRVLIIDGDVSTLTQLQDFLEPKNYLIYTADNEQGGISILNAVKIESVFISFDIPKMNGLSVVNYLRTQFPSIPVIAMSSRVSRNTLSESFAGGVKGHISKPIVSEQLQENLFIFEGHLCWKRKSCRCKFLRLLCQISLLSI